jgi:hypothetical protein
MWPPPDQGQSVTLPCSCNVTVMWRVPLVFHYVVRVEDRGEECTTIRHSRSRRVLVPLEGLRRH